MSNGKDKLDIHKIKENLLGIRRKVLQIDLSSDTTESEKYYFISFYEHTLKIIDTANGEVLLKEYIGNLSVEDDVTYVIYTLSKDIRIIGIFDSRNGRELDVRYIKQKNTGLLDSKVKPITEEEIEYGAMWICERGEARPISQFYVQGDLLAVDLLDELLAEEGEEYKKLIDHKYFYRKIVRISDGNTLYKGGKSTFKHHPRSDGAITPNTAWFDDGIIVISEKGMSTVQEDSDYFGCARATVEATVYNNAGRITYKGECNLKIGRHRLYTMSHTNDYEGTTSDLDILRISIVDKEGNEKYIHNCVDTYGLFGQEQ
jgi:hypothetical protein